MSGVYETRYHFKVQMDHENIHEDEQEGVLSFSIDMSQQEGQSILGIREGSLEAFWSTGGTTRAVHSNGNDLEYVNIRAESKSLLKIDLCFEFNEEAESRFEFEFKVGKYNMTQIGFIFSSSMTYH